MPSLSAAQVERFHEEGYLVVDGILDPVQDLDPVIAEYAHVLDRLAAELFERGDTRSTYEGLGFSDRLIAIYRDSGQTYTQAFDFAARASPSRRPHRSGLVRRSSTCSGTRRSLTRSNPDRPGDLLQPRRPCPAEAAGAPDPRGCCDRAPAGRGDAMAPGQWRRHRGCRRHGPDHGLVRPLRGDDRERLPHGRASQSRRRSPSSLLRRDPRAAFPS